VVLTVRVLSARCLLFCESRDSTLVTVTFTCVLCAIRIVKTEIRELLEQQLNVHDILRYFPDIEADPEAALFLSKAVAIDLQHRVQTLQAELEQAHQDRESALERFIADQERAFEEKERDGLDILIQKKVELEAQVETFEKSLFFQTQLSIRLAQELHQLGSQIDKEEVDRVEALAQASAYVFCEFACVCALRVFDQPWCSFAYTR